jgi:hypothetical protein
MTTHTCKFCDSDYPCDTFRQGEDEHGHERSACDCRETDTCPLCSDYPTQPVEQEPDVDSMNRVRR